MSSYGIISNAVNQVCYHNGQVTGASPALRALVGAAMVHGPLLGVTTITQAKALVRSSRPSIEAALVILKSEDEVLLAKVLAGSISLASAAAQVRRRARLIDSFRSAWPEDRAALGQAVGATALFDSAVSPAL